MRIYNERAHFLITHETIQILQEIPLTRLTLSNMSYDVYMYISCMITNQQ